MVTGSSSGLSSDLAGGADTIVARATPGGRGALAVVRVSGPEAAAVAAAVCPGVDFSPGWTASLAGIHEASGELLDRGVVVTYPSPRSFTGEDMVELTVHGSAYLVEKVIAACVAGGARLAGPGEFTRRAVANGKLDLVQAEAVRDLVEAETAWQLRNAREQLSGALSRRFRKLREELVGLAALVDASLEFEAQAVVVTEEEIRARAEGSLRLLSDLLGTSRAGARIREGLTATIVGPPNAGKSTLFNYLAGREQAIVSPSPGTTRDVLEAELEVGGVRLVIRDTAGLRAGGDEVEAEGRRRALGAAAGSDLVILLWGADGERPAEVDGGVPMIRLRSKADLEFQPVEGWLAISCRTGAGIEALYARLTENATREVADLGGAVAVAERHRAALVRARDALLGADWSLPEVAADDVRRAMGAAEDLLGAVDDEAVLDEVFAGFCVGK